MTTKTPRISNPYPHKCGFRCCVQTPAGEWRNTPTRRTKEEARLVAERVAAALAHEHTQTVASCIDRYLDHHKDKGTRDRYLVTYRQTLSRFFAPVLDMPPGFVFAASGTSLYEALRKSCGAKTGKPIATDTYRNALVVAKGELVLEQMLLTDQLRLHQYGLESGPAGWRRLCWLCGARSAQSVLQPQEAHPLAVRRAPVCPVQLAQSLPRRYPIVHELAQLERRNLLTPTA